MHHLSDAETLVNAGICFYDSCSQEYVKYVKMWNLQVPWMGEKSFHFKIPRPKAPQFLTIR